MILTLILIGIVVAAFIAHIKFNDYFSGWREAVDFIAIIVTVLGMIAISACNVIIVLNNCNTEGSVIAKREERKALVYQLENKTYLNDNNVGVHELFSDIAEFNGKIEWNRHAKTDPWLSWFAESWAQYVEPINYEIKED